MSKRSLEGATHIDRSALPGGSPIWLAASLDQTGRTEEANEALAKAIAMAPTAFDMFVRPRVPWHRPEDYAHMLDGLRKAAWKG